MASADCSPQHVVVCGGGIIGAATAYYLAKRGVHCTVVERSHCACAASGKDAGFLARHLCDGTPLETMARCSFDLHMELAEDERFAACEYRRMDTLDIELDQDPKKNNVAEIPAWVDGPVVRRCVMGSTADTAQVNPYKLTNTFLSAAKDMVGSEVKIARVEDVVVENGRVVSVMTDHGQMAADVAIISMGLWSSKLSYKLHFTPVSGCKGHSIILRPSGQVTWLQVPPPDNPDDVLPNLDSCKKLQQMAAMVSSSLAEATLEDQRACYGPMDDTGLPQVGRIPEVQGAYIATGHGAWGILNAPITGAALAELIVDGHSNLLDLSAFKAGHL